MDSRWRVSKTARKAGRDLSGGMKRRINIAAGILHRPRVLLMDEPTVGIDPQSRNHILETVRELNREGMTVLSRATTWRKSRRSVIRSPSSTTAK